MKFSVAYFLFLSLIIISCATVEMPSGGPIDKTPPHLIAATPSDSTMNFNSKEIIFVFDEFIKSVTKNKVVVNPYLPNNMYDISTQGKKVILSFNDSLRDNTTYTITFNQAIIDITEGNILNRLTYTFSTGNSLDSCSISGKAIISELDLPMSKSIVILTDLSDFNWDTMPMYIDYINDGNFLFSNLPPNDWYIFALEDLNNNMMYEINKEHVGFYSNKIELHNYCKQNNLKILTFLEFPLKKRVVSVPRLNLNNSIVIFNQPLDNPQIAINPSSSNIYTYWSANNDTLFIYNPITKWDTTKIKIVDNRLDTTLNIFTGLVNTKKIAQDTVLQLKLLSYDGQLLPSDSLIIKGSLPYKWINKDSVFLIKNEKDTIRLSLSDDYALTHNIKNEITDGDYELIIKAKTAESIANTYNKENKFRFSKLSNNEISNLTINFTKPLAWNGIIEIKSDLLTKKVNLSQGSTISIIHELLSGKYELLLVKDKNENDKYDTGNFIQRQLPERVYRYPQQIEIIKKWDQSINWDVPNID
ncbi:MAG TPA: Ig-like domain-containing protein [Bacteroidales bacterium]|nr:Ig-like domain-containing protein [Bacteroidales bacterium]